MKILTIKQPWAALIMQQDRRFEFRSWQTKYNGELLIHTRKGIDKETSEILDYIERILENCANVLRLKIARNVIVYN